MSTFASLNDLPVEICQLLNEVTEEQNLSTLLTSILAACRNIGSTMRDNEYSSDHVGTQNAFGDHQLDVDVKTDELMFACLRESGLCSIAASEENPTEIDCGGTGFSVAFDPLDGSSIVDANFAVGTIVGVWPGRGLLGRCGRDQSASLMALYGPRVTIALAFNACTMANGQPYACELTMHPSCWEVTKSPFRISPKAKTFAPGNLRATADNPKYMDLVSYWIRNKYTLRYSGGLVPDVYHILAKGEGVLSNASSPSAKAKLRLLFEAAPIALIIEAAGGRTTVCPCELGDNAVPMSLLDVPATDLDKRVGVCYGSSEEVERFISYIF